MAIRNADVLDFLPTLDTNVYADGDVLFDSAALANFAELPGEGGILDSIHVLDEDDQGVALDLVFLNANVSLGTFNVTPAITDANARASVGLVKVAAADYIDLGGARIATLRGIGLRMKTAPGLSSLWVAGITRGGTPTYTANGLRFKFGITQD
jgi:hypothetical protein